MIQIQSVAPRRGGGEGGRRPPRSIITAINVFADLYVLLSGSIQFFVQWFVRSALQSHYRCCKWLLAPQRSGRPALRHYRSFYSFVSEILCSVGDCKLDLISPRLWIDSSLLSLASALTRVDSSVRKGLVAFVCFNRISPGMNSSPLRPFYGWTPILYSLHYFIKRIIFLRSTYN